MRRIALLALGLAAPALCCSECGSASARVDVSVSVSREREYGCDHEEEYEWEYEWEHEGACGCGRSHRVSREVEWRWQRTSGGSVELHYRSVCYGPRRVRCHVGPWRVRVTGCAPRCRVHHIHHCRRPRGSCGGRVCHVSPHRGHPKVIRRETHVHHHVHPGRGHGARKVHVKKKIKHHVHHSVAPEPVRRRSVRPASGVRRANIRGGTSADRKRGERHEVVSIARNGTVPLSSAPRKKVTRREVRRW